MTRLIIWRHGQTEWNALRRIQGQTDIDLDDVGLAQARSAAEALAAEGPDVLVTSDLRRASVTADALAALTGLRVHLDDRLRERHFGTWQGMLMTEVATAYPEEYARWRRGEPADGCGVEDASTLAIRAAAALRDAAARADGGTVVVATHGGAAKSGLGALIGWPVDVTARIIGLDNCHWSDLRRSRDGSWLLRAHNVGVRPVVTAG